MGEPDEKGSLIVYLRRSTRWNASETRTATIQYVPYASAVNYIDMVVHKQSKTIPCPKPTGTDIESKPVLVLCQICHVNQSSTIVFPCMHCCMCDTCAYKLSEISDCCPICRAEIDRIAKIYLCHKPVNDTNKPKVKKRKVNDQD